MWIIGPILIITFIGFRIILPYRIPEKYKNISFQELNDEFRKVHLLALLIFNISIVLVTLLFLAIFDFINESGKFNSEFIFEIRPDKDFWIVVSMLFGLGFGVILLNFILRLILKDSLEKFWVYYNIKYKFNALLIINFLTGIFICSGVVSIYLGMGSHVQFGNNQIIIKKLFSSKEMTFNYSEVCKLDFIQKTTAPNVNVIDRPHYKVTFNDNFYWSTIDDMRDSKDSDKQIFEFLSKKTNIMITEKEIDE